MTRNEFQSNLFSTTSQMLSAIASEFLSAGGANSDEFQAEYLRDHSDAEMAAECIDGFGLDQTGSFSNDPSHMGFNGYTAEDLAKAFSDLRG